MVDTDRLISTVDPLHPLKEDGTMRLLLLSMGMSRSSQQFLLFCHRQMELATAQVQS
jgi:hypothetical protein